MNKEDLILQKLDAIANDLTELKQDMLSIREDFIGLKNEVHSFKEEMYAFRDEMYSFRGEMYSFKDEMYSFRDEMYSLRDEMHLFKEEMYSFKEEMHSFKDMALQKFAEMDDNFYGAQCERNRIYEELQAVRTDVNDMKLELQMTQQALHCVCTKIGYDYDVPKMDARLGAAELTIVRHTEQIQDLNREVGLA